MDLLSNAERNEFRDGMKDLKDTFHKWKVNYHLAIDSTDEWNEDNDMAYTLVVLDAFVQRSDLNDDKLNFNYEGAIDETYARLTLNVDYLETLGLWDAVNNKVKLNGAKDKFNVNGEDFHVTQITYGDSIDGKPIHVYIYGDPNTKKT